MKSPAFPLFCFGAVIAAGWPGADAAFPVPVTGIHTGIDPVTGAYPPRLRIQDLQNSGPQWDLYIQALAAFHNMPEDDELSYFALSSIHGLPYVPWNGVEQVPGAPLTGYCTHNEVIFAVWHRPLVAVYEQTLAAHVQAAALKYTGPQAAVYRRAADAWRHPYWDWAVDTALPDAFIQENVTVQGPRGPLVLPNPLLQYAFHPFPLNATLFPPSEDARLFTYPHTLRCPDPATNTSNPGMVSSNVAGLDLAGEVYNVYTRVFDFESMSTTACDSVSFEQQHNEIHVAVGCLHPYGHMAELGYSGFEPVFMLHHTAIDRHVALWQAIHDNASMFTAPYTTKTGQFATAPGTNITADSPLKPFYAPDGVHFHTANSARDVAAFGYAYPELLAAQAAAAAQGHPVNGSSVLSSMRLGNGTRDALRRAVMAQVNQLYGPKPATTTTTTTTSSATTTATAATATAATKNSNATTATATTTRTGMGTYEFYAVQPPTAAQYFIRVGIEKAGLPLPALLNVFLGATLAGRLVLPRSPPEGRMHGEISLQKALREASKRWPDSATAPREFVRDNIRWEVVTFAGEHVQLPRGHDVTVQVREEEVQQPSSISEFPVYRNVRVLRDLGTDV
ncbi:putative domain, di-copper centre [Niveomyces insectorum RCEF 264]|uniref:Putative domain, di-copper centre n=1 Tax=Niveomyces insectorum RCEF 264 TaxID=1081102 RepID=A0A167LSW1_9HYPO|nr:putative domain, di-copper centre [Niveomyces insectorum RCEF 264]